MQNGRLEKQIDFIVEIDRVKSIIRKSKLFDGSRFENDAEHSWTICLMALTLREYADEDVDLAKVIRMLLIHDIVEVYAGDTFLYATERADAHGKEAEAAERIFGMLPDEQKREFLALWNEFEERKTPDAKFASVFDRLEPVLQNFKTEGFTWKQNGITREMVMKKNAHIAEGSKRLWEYVKGLLDEAERRGYFPEPGKSRGE